ncbi:hypothetical protein PMAYCL1PPCAC_16094, partial [Pristionchus mayeri]
HLSDAFITFMMWYMHVVSAVTLTSSAGVVYLMLTKTPRHGKQLVKYLLLVQFFITLNDFVLGVLLCAIPLFPLPAGLCEGLLCRMGLPGHSGMILMFFSLGYVAASIVFCFHNKHNAVVELAKYRQLPPVVFRGFLLCAVTLPCVIFIFGYTATGDVAMEYILKEFPDYLWIFSSSRDVIAYSFTSNLPLVTAVYVTVAGGMTLIVSLCLFFVAHTFHLLSR